MFYCRALYFISMCWASVLCGSVPHVHCQVQASGEGNSFAPSLFCACVKPSIKYREHESTDAAGLQIQDSLFHCLRKEGSNHTKSTGRFWCVDGYSRMRYRLLPI